MFRSGRLQFREMVQADRESLHEMFSDPAVMRFAEGTKTFAETGEWLNRTIQDYRSFGIGFWMAEKRDSGECVGQCGIRPRKIQGQVRVEFGYLIARSYWGKGYGKEAAQACRTFVFDHLGVPALTSLIHPANAPSIRIARHLGMEKQGTVFKRKQWLDMYTLENPFHSSTK
ncbi:GNAT family N-acetyltransferase [Natribacillus halophilus]|uniref:Protein N-acetyltransferase, RimJ/RimL family n=1 Tax=Natribacillus halophilus TaxID=549003 RepID=A0A1G8R489_9BACI|nr:GNAT family N-acetyltransferase [Natribacillus halophilus]SDJ11782.1 Protein N-acetyltransferase, RimJ/RimL family [Natribacillus halophilus]